VVKNVKIAADSGLMKSRRIGAFSVLASLAAVSASGFSQSGTASAQTAVTPSAPSDYAVEAFGDPWDWANVEDGGPSRDLLSAGIETSRVADGQLSFTVDKPSFWFFLQGGYADSTPTGRDANLHLVDANKYNRMVMRITSSQPLSAGLLWFGCTEGDNCVGGLPHQHQGRNPRLRPSTWQCGPCEASMERKDQRNAP
jgi:hypothetical protein